MRNEEGELHHVQAKNCPFNPIYFYCKPTKLAQLKLKNQILKYPAGIYLFKANNEDTRKTWVTNRDTKTTSVMSILVSLLLTLNRFPTLLWCFYY